MQQDKKHFSARSRSDSFCAGSPIPTVIAQLVKYALQTSSTAIYIGHIPEVGSAALTAWACACRSS